MRILFVLLFSAPFAVIAQSKLSGDTLITNTGQLYIKEGYVTIGPGSKHDGGYAFISTAPDRVGKNVVMPVQLTAGWEGYKMKIIGFQLVGNETMGKRYVLKLSIDTKTKIYYLCDPELALKAKEIISNNYN